MSSLLLRQHPSGHGSNSSNLFNEKAQADMFEAFLGKPEILDQSSWLIMTALIHHFSDPRSSGGRV